MGKLLEKKKARVMEVRAFIKMLEDKQYGDKDKDIKRTIRKLKAKK